VANAATADYADQSANHYLPGCRDIVNLGPPANLFLAGQCAGILDGLVWGAANSPFEVTRSCVPLNATGLQRVAVVVRWLDRHPERWHEDFMMLALLALHDAWPCR
jgi:hypothetical protein